MRTQKGLLQSFVIVLALTLPRSSFGRAIMPTLQDLTLNANLIIVAQVEEVVTETSGNTGPAYGIS